MKVRELIDKLSAFDADANAEIAVHDEHGNWDADYSIGDVKLFDDEASSSPVILWTDVQVRS
jgi:hypothetical protein